LYLTDIRNYSLISFWNANQNSPLSSSASGRWNLFIHAHQGMMEVSKTTGFSLLDDSGLSSSHFLLLASENNYTHTLIYFLRGKK